MTASSDLHIAVFPGDGIGPEVTGVCLEILETLQERVGGFALRFDQLAAGATYYKETGTDISDESFEAARQADAVLLGAMGLPDIRFPDGTEISPHLKMRVAFELYAGVRPIKAFPNTPRFLLDPRAEAIDLVILRESTEGLFYSHGRGELIDDVEARETLVITRKVCERLFRV